MKRIFLSAGLAVAGVASLHADNTANDAGGYAPNLTPMEASKWWSLSGTLRGFYDDNPTCVSSSGKQSGLGFEASPSVSVNVPLQQTELGLRYTYGLYYFLYRADHGQNPIDQSHDTDLWIDHAFSERWDGKVQDTFYSGQEPQLNGATPTALPQRVEGNNIANTGTVSLHTQLTESFSTDLSYQNTWYDYQNSGTTEANFATQGASLAGLLNQIGHQISLNVNWQFNTETMFFVGYQYGQIIYIGNEPVAIDPLNGQFYFSGTRDQRSQYGYVGVQYAFSKNLSALVEIGAQYSDNYNLPSFDMQSPSQLTPYANIAATYTYLPGDYAQIGFTESHNSTDIASPNPNTGALTLDQDSLVGYASVNHQITPFLMASLIGRWQYSIYHAGAYENEADDFYDLGLNFTYTFNPHFSAECGYNFDYLASDVPGREYARNRVYIGATATY